MYTHPHWDHTWGACVWEVEEIVGHQAGAELLSAEARRPWSHAYLEREMTRTFTDRLVLPGGIEVRHVGGNHAPDSAVVAVPDSGVLLLGDCFYPPPFHLREPGPAGEEIDLPRITALVAEGFAWYVDSHSPPWRPPTTTGTR